MRDTELSAALLYATARGFWHRDHAALTGPYVSRYFDEIVGTAALRSGWVVGQVARLAYPSTAVSAQTLELAAALLDRSRRCRPVSRVRCSTAPMTCAGR